MVERALPRFFFFCVVVALGGCGLLNGLTNGQVRSPFATGDGGDPPVEGEGDDDGGEGESIVVGDCVNDDDCPGICSNGFCVDCTDDEQCGGDVCNEDTGECVGCVGNDDCVLPDLCVAGVCQEPGEGEGEGEGEGGLPAVGLDSTPLPTATCDAQHFTTSSAGSSVEADAFVPDDWFTRPAADQHMVVLFHELGGSPASWRGPPHDIACDLYLRTLAVVLVDVGSASGPDTPYELMASAVESILDLPRDRITVVAASAAVGDFHAFLVDHGGGFEQLVYLSGGGDFAPTTADISEIADAYPARALFMASITDNACGFDPACAAYVTDMQTTFSASRPTWTFAVANGGAHGSALVIGDDPVTNYAGEDFAGQGDEAHTVFVNFLDPEL